MPKREGHTDIANEWGKRWGDPMRKGRLMGEERMASICTFT